MTLRGKYSPRVRPRQTQEEAPDDPRAQAIADAQRALNAAKRALKIKKARGEGWEALVAFAEIMWPDPEFPGDPDKSLFQCKPHHRILAEMVAGIEARTMLRAACSMPPQHGKSYILSRFGLAWILGKHPDWRVLFATYADTLAETRGEELRAILESSAFREVFPKAMLKRGSRSKTEMVFEAGGSINLVGRGSGTTGRPADLFIIDDPYKDAEEAASSTILAKVQEWYAAVVQTRCPVWAPVLIVHTRWNDDDLLGWQCDPEHPANRANPERAKRWKYVNLPTPVGDADLAAALGIEVGAALWPERFPLHHLREIRENNPRIYAALYLGQPAPEDGDFFRAEHFHLYQPGDLPKSLRMYAASDHAVSEKQRADWTVMGSVGVCERGIVWVMPDLFWEQASTDKVVEAMLKREKIHKHLWWRAGRDHITKSIGPFLRKRMLETQTFINLIEEPETGDKVRKAQAIQARMSAGAVRFPAGAPWLMKARTEMLKFPHAKHDDFVDFMSVIGRGLRSLLGAAKAGAANDDRPTTGTIAWIKWAAKQDQAAGARNTHLATM